MPSAQPAISVIMPVYNTAPYLRRALDSVCRQTFKDLEILCVDDGSTDESPAILKEYAAKDRRIRVISHGVNRGYANAMNSGFAVVRGEAIGMVDSDDVIGRNFFAELWKVYARGGCDIAKGRLKQRETDGTWHESDINRWIKEDITNFTWEWTSAIYRASLIRQKGLRLATELEKGQDTLFLFQLMCHGPRIHFSGTAIYYYLRHASSMSKSQTDAFYIATCIGILRLLKEYLPRLSEEGQRRKAFEVIIRFLYVTMNDPGRPYDWTPYLPAIRAILADGPFFTAQGELPLLHRALEAKTVRELNEALKIIITCLGARSLRAKVKASHP